MASGTALISGFSDFVEATGPTYVTGPEDLVNDASNKTFSFKHLTYGDTGMKKMIQGGSDIRESVMFEDGGTFRFTLPGETQAWENPQVLQKTKAHWRFALDHMSWTRQEILLNDRIRYGTTEARFHAYVDLRNSKERRMWTSMWNGIENHLWSQPVVENMEAEGGKEPFSVPAFVNADTNGLFNPQAAGETVWTTIEGLDPTDTANSLDEFRPQQRTYTVEVTSEASLFSVGNIFTTFDMMWKDVRFEQPPSMQEYFDSPAYNKQCIFTSSQGHTAYQQGLRVSQDAFVVAGRQDPAYSDPQYHGIPIKWANQLDTATLYENPASDDTVAEGTANNIGPRYYWLNSNYLYPVFHDEMYFEKDEISRHHNDVDTFVCPVALWYQIICTSRRRQGIVSPSGDLYHALYS